MLILDEPTIGVDAVSRKEFWEMLNKLRHQGITILVSTPYMDEANLCDRVALIQNGTILSIDSPKNITKSFTKKLFGVKVETTAQRFECVGLLKGLEGIDSVFSFGESIHITSNQKDINEISVKEYLNNKGHQGILVEKIDASIEDVFMELMQNGAN